MRKLSLVVLLAATTLLAAPSLAQDRPGTTGGAAAATVGAAVVGGVLVYSLSPLSPVTSVALGAVVGAAVGHWWYSAAEDHGVEAPMTRKSDADGAVQPFRLVTYAEGSHPVIHLAQ